MRLIATHFLVLAFCGSVRHLKAAESKWDDVSILDKENTVVDEEDIQISPSLSSNLYNPGRKPEPSFTERLSESQSSSNKPLIESVIKRHERAASVSVFTVVNSGITTTSRVTQLGADVISLNFGGLNTFFGQASALGNGIKFVTINAGNGSGSAMSFESAHSERKKRCINGNCDMGMSSNQNQYQINPNRVLIPQTGQQSGQDQQMGGSQLQQQFQGMQNAGAAGAGQFQGQQNVQYNQNTVFISSGTYTVAGGTQFSTSNGYVFTYSTYTKFINGIPTVGTVTVAPIQTYYQGGLLQPGQNAYGLPNQGVYTIPGQVTTTYLNGYQITVSTYTKLVDGVATFGTISLGSMQTTYNGRVLQPGENAFGVPNSGTYTLPGLISTLNDANGYPYTVSTYTKIVDGRATYGTITQGMQMTYFAGAIIPNGQNRFGVPNQGDYTIPGQVQTTMIDGALQTMSTYTRILNGVATYGTVTISSMQTTLVFDQNANKAQIPVSGNGAAQPVPICVVCAEKNTENAVQVQAFDGQQSDSGNRIYQPQPALQLQTTTVYEIFPTIYNGMSVNGKRTRISVFYASVPGIESSLQTVNSSPDMSNYQPARVNQVNYQPAPVSQVNYQPAPINQQPEQQRIETQRQQQLLQQQQQQQDTEVQQQQQQVTQQQQQQQFNNQQLFQQQNSFQSNQQVSGIQNKGLYNSISSYSILGNDNMATSGSVVFYATAFGSPFTTAIDYKTVSPTRTFPGMLTSTSRLEAFFIPISNTRLRAERTRYTYYYITGQNQNQNDFQSNQNPVTFKAQNPLVINQDVPNRAIAPFNGPTNMVAGGVNVGSSTGEISAFSGTGSRSSSSSSSAGSSFIMPQPSPVVNSFMVAENDNRNNLANVMNDAIQATFSVSSYNRDNTHGVMTFFIPINQISGQQSTFSMFDAETVMPRFDQIPKNNLVQVPVINTELFQTQFNNAFIIGTRTRVSFSFAAPGVQVIANTPFIGDFSVGVNTVVNEQMQPRVIVNTAVFQKSEIGPVIRDNSINEFDNFQEIIPGMDLSDRGQPGMQVVQSSSIELFNTLINGQLVQGHRTRFQQVTVPVDSNQGINPAPVVPNRQLPINPNLQSGQITISSYTSVVNGVTTVGLLSIFSGNAGAANLLDIVTIQPTRTVDIGRMIQQSNIELFPTMINGMQVTGTRTRYYYSFQESPDSKSEPFQALQGMQCPCSRRKRDEEFASEGLLVLNNATEITIKAGSNTSPVCGEYIFGACLNVLETCKIANDGLYACQCISGYRREFPQGSCRASHLSAFNVPLKLEMNVPNDSARRAKMASEVADTLNEAIDRSHLTNGILRVIKVFIPGPEKGTQPTAELQLTVNNGDVEPRIPDLLHTFNASIQLQNRPRGVRFLALDDASDFILEDIDECKDVSLNYCSLNATCENRQTNFTCTCKPGFVDISPEPLQGYVCSPIRLQPNIEQTVTAKNIAELKMKARESCHGFYWYIGLGCRIHWLGLAIGLSVALLLICLSGVCCCYYCRRSNRYEEPDNVDSSLAYSRFSGPKKGRNNSPFMTHASLHDPLERTSSKTSVVSNRSLVSSWDFPRLTMDEVMKPRLDNSNSDRISYGSADRLIFEK